MTLGLIADIHVDLNDPFHQHHRIPDALCSVLNANPVDTLIIAGDISNNFELTLQSIRRIEAKTGIRCLFIPGNHDLWNEQHPGKTPWQTYRAMQDHPGNLTNGPLSLTQGWLAIGDIGWFDYSFGDQSFSTAEFDRMQIGERIWQDRLMAPWGKSNGDMHRYFYERLEQHLSAADQKIGLVTHMVPHREFVVQLPDTQWRYLNAFLGSSDYGTLIHNYNVRYAVFGHVHFRRRARIEGTTYICCCLGYTDQWTSTDPVAEIARTLVRIDIH
jgi:putative phosphoesterase